MDKFILVTKKAPTNTQKNVFYVDWTDSQPIGQWLSEKPEKHNFHTLVKWKETGLTVILACYDNPENPKYQIQLDNQDTKNEALLKSNLQKCVRRKMIKSAIATGYELIKQDLVAFLRRLPIIMLEDVMLHESISALIWLSAAISKDYQLNNKQIEWSLGIIKNLCEQNQYDDIRHHPEYQNNEFNTPEIFNQINQSDINLKSKNILMSMLFRVSYGGMKGDMNMIHQGILIWLDRFKKNHIMPNDSIKYYGLDKLSKFDNSYIITASADFHCFPHILNIIKKKYPNYSLEEIKKCMWECSSKINLREPHIIEDKWSHMWSVICHYVITIQDNLIG